MNSNIENPMVIDSLWHKDAGNFPECAYCKEAICDYEQGIYKDGEVYHIECLKDMIMDMSPRELANFLCEDLL